MEVEVVVVVREFLLIRGFEPRVAPELSCWSQYWIWPGSHLRPVG